MWCLGTLRPRSTREYSPHLDPKSGALYILKILYSDKANALYEKEATSHTTMWNRLWGVNAPIGKVDGGYAMQLPLVVTCVLIDGHPHFPERVSSILSPHLPAADSEDAKLFGAMDTSYLEALSSWTPELALQAAVDQIASKGLLHNDIHWRHVGLIPLTDTSGKLITSLVPILIDLESVEEVDFDTALTEMAKQTKILLELPIQ